MFLAVLEIKVNFRVFKENVRIVSFICFAIAIAFFSSCADQYVVERLDVGQGQEIVFYGDTYVDVAQCIRYEVNVNGKTVVPQRCICFVSAGDSRDLKFKLLLAKGGNLVGVSVKDNPNMIFAIHDFNKSLTWPGEIEGKRAIDEKEIPERLFKELQNEYPQIKRDILYGHGNRSCHAKYLPPNY